MQKIISHAARTGLAALTMSALMLSMFGVSVVAFAPFANAATGPASAPAPCAVVGSPFLTITQPITEPDSGTNGGNWANDTLTENVNVWLATDGSGTFCANGNTTNGTFTTTGPDSPQNSVPLASGITGTFAGGETWVLPPGTATTTSSSSLTLAADNSSQGSQFNNWQSQVFTNTAGASTYAFTYVTSNNGTWTNADASSGGNSGDITGVPTQSSATVAATNVTSADATLNGLNGDVAADNTGFWVATSTFSTTSTTPPPGVYAQTLPGVAADTAFNAQLSSISGLPAVTPNTTYYFAAWTDVGGNWTPGAVLQFTTGSVVVTAPAVSSLSPTTGSTVGGTVVTITGTGFTGATAVDFGATAATGIVVNSDTSITATSPATSTAGVADVTVTTSLGTSATGAADQFTYSASAGSIGGTVTGGPGILEVTSITPVQTSATSDNTYADGWSYLFNITVPTNEPNLSMEFADWLAADASTIPVAGNMQVSSAQASSTAPVTIIAANTYFSPALDIVGDLSTTTPGLQVQVLVQVKIPVNSANDSYTTNYGVQTLP